MLFMFNSARHGYGELPELQKKLFEEVWWTKKTRASLSEWELQSKTEKCPETQSRKTKELWTVRG